MKTSIVLTATVFMFSCRLTAQTLYVDAQKGQDNMPGTAATPLQSLQKAVDIAQGYSGNEPVTIKVGPGLYELSARLDLKTKNNGNGAAKYTIEAVVIPEDPKWEPRLMPVVQSVSGNNDQKYFAHCAGIFADRANVCIHGIKFTGNANPGVDYYYPIEKDTTELSGLEISQCYFIGDRYGAVIQGAAYVEGPGIHVDHCIFHGCKNAVLAFQNVRDFSITHTIIYGAYECAVWYGEIRENGPERRFNFSNNIVTHCRYFWAETSGHDHSYYQFNHSLITENEHYVGMQNGEGGVKPLPAPESYTENDVRKTGNIKLVEVETEGFPVNYLNLAQGSDGADLGAGLFKTHK
jgi:hypothetical protein